MDKNKTMTVKEFVDQYNALQGDKAKETFVQSIIATTYVPFETKCDLCKTIINASFYKKEEKEDGSYTKILHIDSPAKYMLYGLQIVKSYTRIDVNFKNSVEEFNMLNKHGLLDVIFEFCSEREMKEFKMVLDMVESDVMQNEYETHAFIRNQVERFGELFGRFANSGIKSISNILENEEIMSLITGKLEEVMEQGKKFNIVK